MEKCCLICEMQSKKHTQCPSIVHVIVELKFLAKQLDNTPSSDCDTTDFSSLLPIVDNDRTLEKN